MTTKKKAKAKKITQIQCPNCNTWFSEKEWERWFQPCECLNCGCGGGECECPSRDCETCNAYFSIEEYEKFKRRKK